MRCRATHLHKPDETRSFKVGQVHKRASWKWAWTKLERRSGWAKNGPLSGELWKVIRNMRAVRTLFRFRRDLPLLHPLDPVKTHAFARAGMAQRVPQA
jgi:hypothetical protein